MKRRNWPHKVIMLAIALVIILAFCVYLVLAFAETESTLTREKAYEKSMDLGLLHEIANISTETGDAETVLRRAVDYIEDNYNSTFAQLYDENLTPLLELGNGVNGGVKHNPLDYPEFIAAVMENESGSLVYWYETAEAGGRHIHMSYQWTRGYLIAVGISKYTIKEGINPAVRNGAIALIAVFAAFVLGEPIATAAQSLYAAVRERSKRKEG